MSAPVATRSGLPATTRWLVCVLASIGFAFDIYELLMLPLVIKPAIASLSQPLVDAAIAAGAPAADAAAEWAPGGLRYVSWARALFFLPAIAGGVLGLLGGYLTDLLGRRRVLTFSILLYALSAFAAGFATTLEQLLLLRCLVFIGVCVEFVAAVAWLAELFDDPRQRESALGYTQAFSSLGGLMVGGAYVVVAGIAQRLPAIHGGHEAWRYMLMSGLLPALPLILIRPFLPESPTWARKKAEGRLKRPSFAELFGPGLRRTTILTTLVFASSYGFAFGAIQQLPQILGGPRGHASVVASTAAARADAVASAQAAGQAVPGERELRILGANAADEAVARVTIWQEVGGLAGRLLLALLAVRIASRRALLRVFQVPAVILVPLLFWWISTALGDAGSLGLVKLGAFAAGVVVVAQFSFWGNYIPRVFPLHLRGTGESFAANIGGRVLGTAAAWLTLTFAASVPPSPERIALVAACVAGAYGLVGTLLAHWLPEPSRGDVDG